MGGSRARTAPRNVSSQPRSKTRVAVLVTTRKSDTTRLRILDAAAGILGDRGYSGTKLVDIAARADIQVSTLYYYYPSREELVRAVMVDGSAQVRKHLETVLGQADVSHSAVARLEMAVEAHLRFIIEISSYTKATVRNFGQIPDQMRAEVAKEQAKYGRLWQRLVDAAASHGAYPRPSQRLALRLLILGALNWVVEWWTPERASLDEVIGTALTMTRAALAARHESPAA